MQPTDETEVVNALGQQIGGNHYQGCAIQPITYIMANGLDFPQGNVVKLITRFRDKGQPREDLEKAKHYIDFLLNELDAREAHERP